MSETYAIVRIEELKKLIDAVLRHDANIPLGTGNLLEDNIVLFDSKPTKKEIDSLRRNEDEQPPEGPAGKGR
tara:strand:+ start:821 stop:1036 length:216 start_codon:yes stop_codon:yes gene_type:complete